MATRVLLFGNESGTKVDPDSFILEHGAEAFRKLLTDAPDWLHFLSLETPTQSAEERAAFVNQAKGLIASIQDPELRDLYLRLLQERFSVSKGLYHTPTPGGRKSKKGMGGNHPQAPVIQAPEQQVPWQSLNGAELRFVNLVLKHSELWEPALRMFDPQNLESGLLAELLDHGYALYEEFQTIDLKILHSRLTPVLQELLEGLPDESWNVANAQKEFLESLVSLNLRIYERLRKAARPDLELFLELNHKVKHFTDTLKSSQMSQISPEALFHLLIQQPKELKFIQQRVKKITST